MKPGSCPMIAKVRHFKGSNAGFISSLNFRFDEKRKNQLYCLCLKMTADFGNFVAKTDEKQKTKDEMKQTIKIIFFSPF